MKCSGDRKSKGKIQGCRGGKIQEIRIHIYGDRNNNLKKDFEVYSEFSKIKEEIASIKQEWEYMKQK